VPRERDYQAEYRARRKQFRDLPARVATGHGELPPYIARKAERGELSARERQLYRRQLRAYTARYGPVTSKKRPGTKHRLPTSFDTEEEALRAGAKLNISSESLQTQKRGGRWYLVILR
jgi:hypothetical protein